MTYSYKIVKMTYSLNSGFQYGMAIGGLSETEATEGNKKWMY